MTTNDVPQTPHFEMPTPKIIEEYQYDSGDYHHTKCGETYEAESILDGLRWMREHHHECSNEIFISLMPGCYVKVRLLENGLTEVVYRAHNGKKFDEEKSVTARLFPTQSAAGESDVTIDYEEMNR